MINRDLSFIVVDDSELDRYVTQKFLERTNKSYSIKTFESAENALEMIRENENEKSSSPIIILLDLQMPFMNGFKFVEEFEQLSPEIQARYMIIILTVLSSSSDPHDIFRVFTYPTVKSVLEKPLTHEKLISLLDHVASGIK